MNRRRWIARLLCAVLMLGMLPAAAAESPNAASTLYELGLFQGIGTDNSGKPIFDLERTPTRTEALVMLVRLLGKEAEVKAGTYQHPFSDVDSWADAYVGYAYEHGLTTGTSATTFGGGSPADGNTYATFVLRALGYTDKTGEPDFTYSRAIDFAKSVGLTERDYAEGFSRGDVAELSLSALTQPIKGESMTLVGRLTDEGAVDRSAAERAGILSAPIVAEYDGTKLLMPAVYDEKGNCELIPATVLSVLPKCQYMLSFYGWSKTPWTMRERFLIGLSGTLYNVDGPLIFSKDSFSVIIPKNSENATTYTFFVDENYRILAYIDSSMLTPDKPTVPLETKVSIDGGAIYKEVTATVAEKLGRAEEERFTISEQGYESEYTLSDGSRETVYPIEGEELDKVTYISVSYVPKDFTTEMVKESMKKAVFDMACFRKETESPIRGAPVVGVPAGQEDFYLLVLLFDKDMVCLGHAIREL